MEVIGVRVEMPSNSPIVLLKETQGDRYLPIWIGAVEATAIAFAQQGMVSVRPLTHDLFKDVLEVLNIQLRTVNITALRDGIFYADLVFSNGAEVSARPSDSIALALRTGAQIFASEEILDEAGVAIPDEQQNEETEVEKFRRGLRPGHVNPRSVPLTSCVPVCLGAVGNVATRRWRSLTPPPGPAYGASAVGSQLPWR
jgi:bifunctional DNase/RNase